MVVKSFNVNSTPISTSQVDTQFSDSDELSTVESVNIPLTSDVQGGAILVVGRPGSGKNNLIKLLMYYNIIKFWGNVFVICPTAEYQKQNFSWLPSEYILDAEHVNEYLEAIINNQRKTGRPACVILDDVLANENVKLHDNKKLIDLIANARWHKVTVIISTQVYNGINTKIRKMARYTYVTRSTDAEFKTMKEISEGFGGTTELVNYLREHTKNYCFVRFTNEVTQRTKEKNVDWFKPPKIGEWATQNYPRLKNRK